jgi:AcrR family transcriptional regulator
MGSTASKIPQRSFHHGNLRQSLLEAAMVQEDIANLSLRQLAAGLGVSAAAVYRHFADRNDLLAEVARIGFERLEKQFADAFDITRPPADAPEATFRLRRLAEAYLGFADTEPALWRLIFSAQAEPFRGITPPEGCGGSYQYLPAALLGLHQTGIIPTQPNERDALFAWSAIHGAATLRAGLVPGALMPLTELATEVAERVIKSLQ